MSSQSISFQPASVIKKLPWSFDKKAALGLLLILVTFSLVGWLYLGQASIITSSTLRIDKLRQETDLLERQNVDIALEIAEFESINHIETRARELGLGPTQPTNIRYLAVQNYPAPAPVDELEASLETPTAETSSGKMWLNSAAAWITGSSE